MNQVEGHKITQLTEDAQICCAQGVDYPLGGEVSFRLHSHKHRNRLRYVYGTLARNVFRVLHWFTVCLFKLFVLIYCSWFLVVWIFWFALFWILLSMFQFDGLEYHLVFAMKYCGALKKKIREINNRNRNASKQISLTVWNYQHRMWTQQRTT